MTRVISKIVKVSFLDRFTIVTLAAVNENLCIANSRYVRRVHFTRSLIGTAAWALSFWEKTCADRKLMAIQNLFPSLSESELTVIATPLLIYLLHRGWLLGNSNFMSCLLAYFIELNSTSKKTLQRITKFIWNNTLVF